MASRAATQPPIRRHQVLMSTPNARRHRRRDQWTRLVAVLALSIAGALAVRPGTVRPRPRMSSPRPPSSSPSPRTPSTPSPRSHCRTWRWRATSTWATEPRPTSTPTQPPSSSIGAAPRRRLVEGAGSPTLVATGSNTQRPRSPPHSSAASATPQSRSRPPTAPPTTAPPTSAPRSTAGTPSPSRSRRPLRPPRPGGHGRRDRPGGPSRRTRTLEADPGRHGGRLPAGDRRHHRRRADHGTVRLRRSGNYHQPGRRRFLGRLGHPTPDSLHGHLNGTDHRTFDPPSTEPSTEPSSEPT